MDRLRISAKTLGTLALPTFCPRCFWLRVHLRNRLPFALFPGIFSTIDSYSKAVTHGVLARNSVLPDWLIECHGTGIPIPVPHHSRFQFTDDGTGITLTGVPDEIIRCSNGHVVLDYKTSRITKTADALLPMYRVQLGCYALIAERVGITPVVALSLIYYEPIRFEPNATVKLVDSGGFSMRFRAKVVGVDLNATREIPRLLREARSICQSARPPAAATACRDCISMDHLMRLLHA